jgi:UDP-glucuronate decarboxylase
MGKKQATYLITGGAGFLGSHLCDALITRGERVIALDNFMTGSRDNIEHLLDSRGFSFHEHDIEYPFKTEDEIDFICHLACPASPPHYQKDPVKTMRICFQGTLNFLELSKQKSACFFMASTSEVYGDPDVHPQVESYRGAVNPHGPRACYDEGKRIGEALCFEFHRQYGVPIKVVRIFNTYGPRMDPNDGRVVSNFIMQALERKALTIYGDGRHTRSFCYVDDLIDGFVKFLDDRSGITGPINLGNPEEYKVLELAYMVLDKMKLEKDNYLEYRSLPIDDPMQRCPDISLAKSSLKWSPRVQIHEGLQKTIDYFSMRLQASV